VVQTRNANTGEIYELVSFKYKNGVSFEEQQEATERLSDIVASCRGFKFRNFYYSEGANCWFDFVSWETMEDAKKASNQVMENPVAQEVFALMEQESIMCSHYSKIGEVRKD